MGINMKVGVEVPLFLIFFAAMLGDPVSKNFVIYRTCYVILGYNISDCEKLGSQNQTNATHDIERIVEPEANVILMTIQLVCSIVPAILCLFIGPWSDRHGRRPVLLVTMAGSLTAYFIKTIISLMPNLSPWFLVLESVPSILSGGFSTFIMVSLCYITDVTTTENRGMRMAVFECILATGILLGTFLSSYTYAAFGYVGVFTICTISVLVAWIFTFFLVGESIVNISEIEDASIFSIVHIKDMIKTTLKNRESYKRSILLLSIMSLVLYIFAINDGSVVFFYLREKFQWSLKKYTLYSSMSAIIWIIGTFVGVYILHKLLKISETSLLVIGFMMMMFSMLFQGLAIHDWQIYTACAIRGLGGVTSPMLRSLISKVVAVDEIGKIFSLTVALEALVSVISSPVYTIVYNLTLTTFSGAFSILCAGFYFIEVLIILAIITMKKKQSSSDCNVLISSNLS